MVQYKTKSRILQNVKQTLEKKDKLKFQEVIKELHAYDLAQLYEHLSTQYRKKFLAFLSDDDLAELIQASASAEQIEVLESLGIEKSLKVLERVDNDDVVSLLTDLEPDKTKEILAGMKKEDSAVIQNLMKYPPETAGRIMNNQFVWINKSYTVREAVDKLKDFAELAEYLNYLYVIDHEKN